MNLAYYLFFAVSVALFLAGLPLLTTCLQNLAGSQLDRFLVQTIGTAPRAFFAGLLVTAAVHSSSAVTVFCIGLADSGILGPIQLAAIIMGSNIGTTCTAHLFWLTGQAAASSALAWLAPDHLGPLLMGCGLLLTLPVQRKRIQFTGGMLLGLGMILAGLAGMESALAPLGAHPAVELLFEQLSHPVAGVLAGTVITAILQSSSTSVGILQAFAATGTVSFPAAVAIICGQNIGTCSTACLAASNAGKHAKFVARFHLYFNILGAVLFLAAFHLFLALFPAPFQHLVPDAKGIAMIHTVFNIASTILLLPLLRQLVALSQFDLAATLGRRRPRAKKRRL